MQKKKKDYGKSPAINTFRESEREYIYHAVTRIYRPVSNVKLLMCRIQILERTLLFHIGLKARDIVTICFNWYKIDRMHC